MASIDPRRSEGTDGDLGNTSGRCVQHWVHGTVNATFREPTLEAGDILENARTWG